MGLINFPKERPFIGREDLIGIFREAVKDKFGQTQADEKYLTPRIILYHGIAGIGKSSLRKKLIEELTGDWPAAIWAIVDFQESNNILQQNALFRIRADLKSNKQMDFPAFDLAFAIYWSKANPAIPLNAKNFQFWDEIGLVGNIIAMASGVHIISLIPKVGKAAGKGAAFIKDHWTMHVEPALNRLAGMESHEVMERLPYFLAMDIRNFMAESRPPIVLFFDTYEALVGDKRDKYAIMTQDKWIRELIRQLPEAIFVFTGRNELDWENHDKECARWLESHSVEIFDETLAMKYLSEGGIESGAIKEKIYTASKGVPFYLSLSLKTYDNIVGNCKEPSLDDFGGTHQEIFERFLRNLNDMEQKALEVLSAARKFDRDIFRMLVNKSEIGVPVSDFDRLIKHTFISIMPGEDSYVMHELMREHFHDFGDKDILIKAHKWLYGYYRAMIKGITVKNIPEKAAIAAPEMSYHKLSLWPKEKWFRWFIKVGHIFHSTAKWGILEKIWLNALEVFVNNKDYPKILTSLNNLGHLSLNQGRFNEASIILKKAIELGESLFGRHSTGIINGLSNLSIALQQLGEYKEAESLLRRALTICNEHSEEMRNKTQEIKNNLACVLQSRGKYKEAQAIFIEAIKYNKNTYGMDHEMTSSSINNLASLFLEIGHFKRANCLFKIAINIDEKILVADRSIIAKVYGNLAASYACLNDLQSSETCYQKAINIERNIFKSNHPQLAIIINGYGEVCRQLKKYDVAQTFLEESLKLKKAIYGNSHPSVATTLNNLGLLYIDRAKLEKDFKLLEVAEDYLNRSIEISDMYSINDLHDAGANIYNLATLYFEKKDFISAEPLIIKAYNILVQKHGPRHQQSIDILKSIVVLYESWNKPIKAKEYRNLLNDGLY